MISAERVHPLSTIQDLSRFAPFCQECYADQGATRHPTNIVCSQQTKGTQDALFKYKAHFLTSCTCLERRVS